MITYYPVTDNYAEVLIQLQATPDPKAIEFRLTEFILYTGDDIPAPYSPPPFPPPIE